MGPIHIYLIKNGGGGGGDSATPREVLLWVRVREGGGGFLRIRDLLGGDHGGGLVILAGIVGATYFYFYFISSPPRNDLHYTNPFCSYFTYMSPSTSICTSVLLLALQSRCRPLYQDFLPSSIPIYYLHVTHSATTDLSIISGR